MSDRDLAMRLVDAAPVPIGYIDASLVVRLCGTVAASVLGKRRDEIVGRHSEEVFGPENETIGLLHEVLQTSTPRTVMMSQASEDGRGMHWEVSFVPDLEGDEVVGIIALGFDVTDLVETQRRVSESEHLYRSIGELIPYGTWTADEDGALTYISESFAEMAGRDSETLLGWGWLELLPSQHDREEARADWHRATRNQTARDTKHVVRGADGHYRHLLCRGVRLEGGVGQGATWAGIHIDITESERRLQFREALGVVKDMLVTSLDTEAQLALVGGAVLRPTGADFAAVIAPVDGEWQVRYATGENATMPRTARFGKEDMPLTLAAFETGKIQVSDDPMHDERMNKEKARQDGLRSIAVLPIKRNGIPICLLSLAYTSSQIVADRPQMDFFHDLLGSLDLALQAAAVHEHERHIAETLQESLLAVPQHLPNVEIAYLYKAAAEEARVGGDFYDAFEVHGRIAFLIGDVAGSGLGAAALTALAKNTIRAHLIDGQSPARALEKANLVLYTFTEPHEFATVFVGLLEPDTGELKYACAGHPPPVTIRRERVGLVSGEGTILGAFPDSRFTDYSCRLDGDEALLLYTDGITEARAPEGMYGEEGLTGFLESMRDADLRRLPQLVLNDARAFAGNALEDDVAILAIKRRR